MGQIFNRSPNVTTKAAYRKKPFCRQGTTSATVLSNSGLLFTYRNSPTKQATFTRRSIGRLLQIDTAVVNISRTTIPQNCHSGTLLCHDRNNKKQTKEVVMFFVSLSTIIIIILSSILVGLIMGVRLSRPRAE